MGLSSPRPLPFKRLGPAGIQERGPHGVRNTSHPLREVFWEDRRNSYRIYMKLQTQSVKGSINLFSVVGNLGYCFKTKPKKSKIPKVTKQEITIL